MSKFLAAVFLIFVSAYLHAEETPWLIGYASYLNLTGSDRIEYSRQVREAYAEFEKAMQKDMTFAENSPFSLWWAETAAADDDATCAVGGIFRKMVNGHCPTYGRPCDGQKDGFRCGKIFGEACIARQPVNSLSARCNQASTAEISADTYRSIKAIVDRNLDKACAQPAAASAEACTTLKKKLSSLNQKYTQMPPLPPKRPNPLPQPIPPKPKPGPKDKDSVVDGDTCKGDRDQGNYGTCHAFCLTCVYDQALKKKTNKKSRVSANWIAMLSVVDRLCDSPESANQLCDQVMAKGWLPERNLNLIAAVGACQESTYIPYSHTEGQDWAAGFASKGAMSANRGINPKPPSGFDDERWKKQFGIAADDAYELFCPHLKKSIDTDISDYPTRLEKLRPKVSEQFYNCAKEALENSKTLSGHPKPTYGDCKAEVLQGDDATKLAAIKDALAKDHRPVPIVLKTDVEGHNFHCVTATGYDDAKKQITLVNSWGPSGKFKAIDYSGAQGVGDVVQIYSPGCAFGESHSSSSAKPTAAETKAAH